MAEKISHFVPLLVIAFLFLLSGTMVFINKKPLIISKRVYLSIFLIIFIGPVIELISNGVSTASMYLSFGIILLMIAFMAYYLSGYIIMGVNGDDFTRALTETLTGMGYKYEMSFSSIRIKEPEMEIYIAMQSWIGSGQIRMRTKSGKEDLKRIIDSLKSKNIKPNFITPGLYLFMGVAFIVMDILMFTGK
ncbi:MAG: hypothetical protein NTW49_07305 [Bacteroidia bacterium]|nr:hypothetical protein [Bacteroidia bacterium]